MAHLSAVEQAIANAWPVDAWRDVNVVVAVSGGRDSVALLRALYALKTSGSGQLHIAHLNHQLRGQQSDIDEQFVRDLAESLSLPFHATQADIANAARQAGDGLESAARTARYEFLQTTAEHCGARYVATGHTADDQVETILHRVLRGTGIAGLAGMALTRPLSEAVTLIRPLLRVRRAEIDQYVGDQNLRFRDDNTNDDLNFTRNRIRQTLLPKLRTDFNANVDKALLRLASLAGENQSLIDDLVRQLVKQCCTRIDDDSVGIDCEPLMHRPRYLVRELLMQLWRDYCFPQQAMGKPQWDALADLVTGSDDACDLPSNIRVTKTGDQLTLKQQL